MWLRTGKLMILIQPAMGRRCGRIAALSLIGVALQLAGLILFVLGFFPVKPALNGKSDVGSAMPSCDMSNSYSDDNLSWLSGASYQEACGVPRQFDRLVIMIVDGMPAEFVLGREGQPPPAEIVAAMPFIRTLLSAGKGLGYHAKAAPPTVTMPRIKAMTSGAIAGFLDVAFNFNTQALLDDNLIDQLATAGRKMVMFGDETWLKLFPDLFTRHDGVSSFYVRDTVEVDHNVTRHLEVELAATYWDLMVLHYLGLDHVGHLGGRSSSLMAPKLKEMDDVIQMIYEKLLISSDERRTLLMVGSDHGMTDGGNHGGASYQEADALAIFIPGRESVSTSCGTGRCVFGSNRSKDAASLPVWPSFQVDLVPTLALLLGVPIPKNSVGALLPQLFTTLTFKEQLRALELNAWQLLRLLHVRSPRSWCVNDLCSYAPSASESDNSQGSGHWNLEKNKEMKVFCEFFRLAMGLHTSWRHIDTSNVTSEQERLYTFEAARDAYLRFLKPASEWLARGTTEKNIPLLICGGMLMLLSTLLLFWVILYIYEAKLKATEGKTGSANHEGYSGFALEKIVAVGGVCLHAGSLASSSFVEEEQYTCHFLVSTLYLAFLRQTLQQPINVWLGLMPRPLSRPGGGKALNGIQKNPTPKFPFGGGDTIVQVLAVAVILLCGRLLRAWHRGGVNWAHLPDVAKWLDTVDMQYPTALRYGALIVISTSSCLLIMSPTRPHLLQRLIASSSCISSALIFSYVRLTTTGRTSHSDTVATFLARSVFGVLGIAAVLAVTLLPWIEPLRCNGDEATASLPRQETKKTRKNFPVETVITSAMQSAGYVLISCWCLLQVLLQQPVNAVPVALLLGQLLATVVFFRRRDTQYDRWLQVLTLQWMGESGHFGLGNSNTLATVDVAGAYIGLSSHSAILSGILAFVITYASPFLFMVGMLLLTPPTPLMNSKDPGLQRTGLSDMWLLETVAAPCIVPLALNGLILVAFTAILILMQDHLFVWSVFSPKYLYICAATASTAFGALIYAVISTYCTFVVVQREHWLRLSQVKLQISERKTS